MKELTSAVPIFSVFVGVSNLTDTFRVLADLEARPLPLPLPFDFPGLSSASD